MKPDVERVLEKLGLEVTRKGRDLWGLCPFHADTNATNWHICDDPSSDRHGYHRCFACSAHGGLLGLVAHLIGLDPDDDGAIKAAWRWLRDGGLSSPEELRRVAVVTVERSSRRRFKLPRGARFQPVKDWLAPARDYLLEERKLSPETVDAFGLGYAMDGRLGSRIVIPVRARVGNRVVSYTARSFVDDEKRYLEPDEEEDDDQRAIFGEHLWPDIRERRLLFVAEGSFDAMAIHQHLPGAVVGAIFGSEVSDAQLDRLATFEAIVITTDPDAAGNKVARAIADLASSRVRPDGVRIERAVFPRGKDASALAARDDAKLRDLLVGAVFRLRAGSALSSRT